MAPGSKLPPMGVLRQMLADLAAILLPAVAVLGPCCGQDQGQGQGTGRAAIAAVFGLVRDGNGKPAAGAIVREVRRTLGGVTDQTAQQLGIGTKYGASATTNEAGNPARDLELFTGHRPRRGGFRLTRDRYKADAHGKATLTRLLDDDVWVWARLDGRLVHIAQIPSGIAAMALGKQQALATNVVPTHANVLQLQLRVIR
ncbi:MAG: hypothetical protein ACI8UD_001797 [Planctomycetota bacterium]|jgi:hypothetical protein